MKINSGKFRDSYRGDGRMVSFGFSNGWLLFGFRPLNWYLYFVRLQDKPAFRIYFGPFEIEYFRNKWGGK